MGVLYVAPLLAAIIGAASGASSCAFTDDSGSAISSLTPKGDQQLKCPSAKINVLQGETGKAYDNVVCIGGEWYATSCTGAAASLGASARVSCAATPDVKACGFSGLSTGAPPEMIVVDGAQVRVCAADETLTVQGLNAAVGFSRATCLGAGKWLVFSCEGSIQAVTAPLVAYCAKTAAPPTPGAPPTTTAAPLPPTTTPAAAVELLQYKSANSVCRNTFCDFRYYSSAQLEELCTVFPKSWGLYAKCANGITRIDGVETPAGHIFFNCVVDGTKLKWWSHDHQYSTIKEVSVPANPIIRCDGDGM